MISRSGNTCQSLSKHNKSHAPLLSLEWPHRRTGYYSHSGGQMWSGIVSLQCMHLDQQDNSVPYQLLLYICITILKNTTLQLHLTIVFEVWFREPLRILEGFTGGQWLVAKVSFGDLWGSLSCFLGGPSLVSKMLFGGLWGVSGYLLKIWRDSTPKYLHLSPFKK